MTDPTTYDAHLAAAFSAYADRAPVDVDARALAHAVAIASGRRPTLAERWASTFGARRIALLALLALLVVAAGIALVVAARLLNQPPPIFGEFKTTGGLPPVEGRHRIIDAVASLSDGRVLVTGSYDSYEGPDEVWSFLYDPRTGTFNATGGVSEMRSLSSATTLLDGRVLVVGGWHVDAEGAPVLPAFGELYDPRTGAFERTRGPLATPRYGHTATLLTDGRVLVTGGSGSDFNAEQPNLASAEVFDPITGLFRSVRPMAEPRVYHAATRLADGRVLVTGGMESPQITAVASAELFDPATGRFAPTGSLTMARYSHTTTTMKDGRVLIAGGSTKSPNPARSDPTASAELYDPATGLFVSTASLSTERAGSSATLLPDGRVLVAGGANVFGAPRTAELFDPATGTFVAAGATSAAHGAAWTGLLPNGQVLLLGDDPDNPATATGIAEVWSAFERPTVPSNNSARVPGRGFFPFAHSSSVLRSGHTATRLADGRVLLAGGSDMNRPGSGPLSTAEILDPATGRSTVVGDMTAAREGHVAVLLADGRVLVAGGEPMSCADSEGCRYPAPSAEIFDPASGRFTPVAADLGLAAQNSRQGRSVAILLSDHQVLYIGQGFGPRLARLIDPTTGSAEWTAPVPCSSTVSLVGLADGRVFVQCGGQAGGAFEYDATGRTITEIKGVGSWDAAIGLADGRVLVLRTSGDAAIFDPATATYTPTDSMVARGEPADPRYPDPFQPRLSLLADGRVLVTGGLTTNVGSEALATAELYDPSSGTFRSVGPMLEPRSRHTSTVLADGRVLLVGGVSRSPDRTDPEPASAEVYNPTLRP